MNSQTLRPLQVGDVVSAGLRLYRSNLGRFLPIAVVAALWPLGGVLGLGIAILIGGIVGNITVPAIGILVGLGLGLAALVLMAYCGAKSAMNAAVIARLAFQELVNQPESVAEARHTLRPRLWRFFWLQGLLVLALIATQLGTAIVQGILNIPLVLVMGDNILASLLGLILNLGATAVYYWVLARLFVPDLAIAVESDSLPPTKALQRSWMLSQGFAVRISLILLVASLVTMPFFIIAAIPLFLAMFASLASLGSSGAVPSPGIIASLGGAFLLSMLLFLVMNLLLMAFWQSINAVLYYDLCSRQEGLDLKISRGKPTETDTPDATATRSKPRRLGNRTSTHNHKNPVDEQWAAAIAAMNAGQTPRQPTPSPETPDAPPSSAGPLDEDEIPTQVARNRPPALSKDSEPSPAPPAPTPPGQALRISPQAEPIAATLSDHGGLYNMGSQDFEDVETYLRDRSTLPIDQRKQQSLTLARRLKDTIQLAKLPGKLTPDLFLEALYLAYRDRS
ncbi:MAG: hypothetical protein VKJ85_06525 [Prochlorothrix sp.]|nr:hypothetical protein [Prochlorothrix sp.]